jgi:hypothetical protein
MLRSKSIPTMVYCSPVPIGPEYLMYLKPWTPPALRLRGDYRDGILVTTHIKSEENEDDEGNEEDDQEDQHSEQDDD